MSKLFTGLCIFVIYSFCVNNDSYEEVYFSPPLPTQLLTVQQAIILEIEKFHTSILIQMTEFTDETTARELINAHKRGVKVEIILSRDCFKIPKELAREGIPVFIEKNAHNEVIIFDNGITTIVGSYKLNYGETSRNITIRHDDPNGKLFVENYLYHRSKSVKYELRPKPFP